MSGHLSPSQVELLDNFEAGDMGEVEFFELALEAGISLSRIDQALRDQRGVDLDLGDYVEAGAGVLK